MLSKFVPIRYANVVSCLTWAGLLLSCGFIRMEALQLAGPSIQPQQTLSISGKDTIPTRQASAIETTAASSNSSTAIQPRSAMPATSYLSAVSGGEYGHSYRTCDNERSSVNSGTADRQITDDHGSPTCACDCRLCRPRYSARSPDEHHQLKSRSLGNAWRIQRHSTLCANHAGRLRRQQSAQYIYGAWRKYERKPVCYQRV